MFENGEGQHLGRTQRVLLEISTLLYFFAKNSAIPLMQQFVYYLVAKKYNFSAEANEEIEPFLDGNTNNTNYTDLSVEEQVRLDSILHVAHKVSTESSLIVLYLNVAELFPSAIVVLFLGCWSDVTGRRKFLMWLPCLGNAIYALGFILPIYICDGDIDHPATMTMFVVACMCSGLSGTVPGFLSGNASYISDTDSPRRRTLRLAIVEMTIGLTFGLASIMNGYWINFTDHFEQPLWFIFACSLAPFFILILFLKEPNGEISNQLGHANNVRDFRGIRHVFGCKTFSQKKLWAVFFAFQIYVFVQQGQERTFVLFLQNAPLYWNSVKIGIFLFVLYTVSGVGSWPGIPLLQKCCDDVTIAMIAMVSKLVGSLFLAFAKGDALIYISSVAQVFHLTPYAVARSVASKQVGEDEQGSVYALIHSMQSVVAFLGPVAHNALFFSTLQYDNGLIFLVSGPILLLPLVLLGIVKIIENMEEEGYHTGDDLTKPLSPSMTPLSETSGFSQRPADFGAINDTDAR